MSSTQVSGDSATETSSAPGIPMAFEVTTLPVADVDRAKAFYLSLGWRLDIDFKPGPDIRGVQFTPPAGTSILAAHRMPFSSIRRCCGIAWLL